MGTIEFTMMVAVFSIGASAVIVPVLGISEQDMWLAGLIGWGAGVGYVLFLSYCKELPDRYLLAKIILSLYALYLAALVTRNLGEISNLTILDKTPQVVLNTIIVLLAAYATSQGIEVISRLAGLFLITFALAEIILILLALPVMHLTHLQPMLEHSLGLIVKDAIPFISFPFMETVVFLPLLNLVKKPQKALLGGILIAGALLVVAIVAIILVLPPGRIQHFISPTFLLINSLPAAGYVKAIQVLIWLQTGFLKLAVLHFVVSKQLGDAFNLDYQKIILPVSILIINLSILSFDNTIQWFNFTFEIYPYYAIPLQIVIPMYFIIAGWLSNRTPSTKS